LPGIGCIFQGVQHLERQKKEVNSVIARSRFLAPAVLIPALCYIRRLSRNEKEKSRESRHEDREGIKTRLAQS
jgi:hypothetical protein